MSGQQAVRTPIRIGKRLPRRRGLVERILFRLPMLATGTTAFVLRLPHRSGVRRWLLSFLVRRAYAAVDRGDLNFLMRVLYDPGAELIFPGGGFADFDRTYRGREAGFEAYRAWIAAWNEYRREPREMVDLGDRVLILIQESGRGKQSGIQVEASRAMLLTFRRGKVVRHEEFQDRDQALAAVGLWES